MTSDYKCSLVTTNPYQYQPLSSSGSFLLTHILHSPGFGSSVKKCCSSEPPCLVARIGRQHLRFAWGVVVCSAQNAVFYRYSTALCRIYLTP